MYVPAQIRYIALSLLFVLATVNFVKTTLSIVESSKRLEEAKSEVAVKESEIDKLEQELDYKKTSAFVEEEARNKLNLIKPGEDVFVMPLAQLPKEEPAGVLGSSTSNIQLKPIKQWVNLFF